MCKASVLCSYTNNKRRCRRILKFVTGEHQHRINYVADKQNPLLKKRRWQFSHYASVSLSLFQICVTLERKRVRKSMCALAIAARNVEIYLFVS
jgi:hypothetical protein